MTWLLWALLLANLIFFSTIQWGESVLDAGKVSLNQPPLNAEKIHVIRSSIRRLLWFHSLRNRSASRSLSVCVSFSSLAITTGSSSDNG